MNDEPRGFDIGARKDPCKPSPTTAVSFGDETTSHRIGIDSSDNAYLKGKEPKPLPSKCPECGAINPWIFRKIYEIKRTTNHDLSGYFCEWCSSAIELFQGTERFGMRKYLPVEAP